MKWIYEFVRKYPQAIVTGPIPLQQVIDRLKKAYGAEEISLEAFSPCQIRMQQENAWYIAQDRQMDLPLDGIQLKAVQLPVTELTRHYTEKDFVPWNAGNGKNGIYVVYEEQVGYFYCNSSMLHLELTMARGIAESDVTNRTEAYENYIGLMQRYIEDYTDLEHEFGLVWSQEMKML